ncbi:hypothetical protein BDR07DRAFT_849313 [Suillus spraguei]|nr:hypothetical protein BDR07DRAFT_849313 [Suillus spraguei]
MLQVTGTPFDFGTQRYEYPFPPTQGTSGDPFLPLSSSIAITSPSNSIWPSWPAQVTKSFPLTAPPPRKVRAHPKLRSVAAREPPVPPSLANKRSFWNLSLQRQASAESQQSDLSDTQTRGRKLLPGSVGFTEADTYPTSDSEITMRRRQPSAHVVYLPGSRMDPTKGTANQNGLITCGGRAPEVPAVGAPASGPGPNGGHNKLDVGLHSHTPSGHICLLNIVLSAAVREFANSRQCTKLVCRRGFEDSRRSTFELGFTLLLGFLRSWQGTY